MSRIRVAATVKLKEGFDMSRLKMELANSMQTEYRLKNIDMDDDDTGMGIIKAHVEQPRHILKYELSGELTQNDVLAGLEKTRDKLKTFVIEGLNIED
ncbi:hypothetical protein AB1K84_19930 [Mesobacillus foraminis]|uniref:hypothetical protein n=1 Tax=Mesobacillus foraminis TaxID=279826 RepID=UPI00399FCAFB